VGQLPPMPYTLDPPMAPFVPIGSLCLLHRHRRACNVLFMEIVGPRSDVMSWFGMFEFERWCQWWWYQVRTGLSIVLVFCSSALANFLLDNTTINRWYNNLVISPTLCMFGLIAILSPKFRRTYDEEIVLEKGLRCSNFLFSRVFLFHVCFSLFNLIFILIN
jgi:hypothetical protein